MSDDEGSCRWRLLCFRRDAELADREQLLDLAPRIAERLGRCGFRADHSGPACGLEVVRLKSGTLMHVVPASAEDRDVLAAEANRHVPKVKVSA